MLQYEICIYLQFLLATGLEQLLAFMNDYVANP